MVASNRMSSSNAVRWIGPALVALVSSAFAAMMGMGLRWGRDLGFAGAGITIVAAVAAPISVALGAAIAYGGSREASPARRGTVLVMVSTLAGLALGPALMSAWEWSLDRGSPPMTKCVLATSGQGLIGALSSDSVCEQLGQPMTHPLCLTPSRPGPVWCLPKEDPNDRSRATLEQINVIRLVFHDVTAGEGLSAQIGCEVACSGALTRISNPMAQQTGLLSDATCRVLDSAACQGRRKSMPPN